jgi:hypothetical protein
MAARLEGTAPIPAGYSSLDVDPRPFCSPGAGRRSRWTGRCRPGADLCLWSAELSANLAAGGGPFSSLRRPCGLIRIVLPGSSAFEEESCLAKTRFVKKPSRFAGFTSSFACEGGWMDIEVGGRGGMGDVRPVWASAVRSVAASTALLLLSLVEQLFVDTGELGGCIISISDSVASL